MQGSEDLAPLLEQPEDNFGYRQGQVVAWNPDTNANQIRVGEIVINDMPLISPADLVGIRPGDPVAILKYNNTYGVLGKITHPGAAGIGTPWQPVPLYPQFISNGAAGSLGVYRVNVGVLAAWEGRIYTKHHTKVELDGVWGTFSGSNNAAYEVQLSGFTRGSWVDGGGLVVGRKGPYDITPFMHQEFIKIEVKIVSSTGTGEVAISPLACFLRL